MKGLISGRRAKLPEADTPAKQHWSSYAKGESKKRGVMNKTETEFFEAHIAPLLATGEILESWYEAWTWKLTDTTPEGKPGIRYTADFVVMRSDGRLEAYEVKGGFATNEDLNRLKLAANKIPIPFFLATKQRKADGGGFKITEY